ncbi:MAG: asparagine synthase-related protein [Pseudolabrys sp.]
MTAIAGLWRFDNKPDVADGCGRMLAAQEMYGPDALGEWSEGGVAIGRRLMRLLPEDKFDRQPLSGGGGKYVLVADVRLDNRDELAAKLNIPDAKARELCDAAILLAAFEHWDNACFDHLIGDYAFALWDKDRRRLLLARDPLGTQPVHYHRGRGFVAFASMPKGLLALPGVPYAPDEERMAEFLVLMPEFGSPTFFQGIERVEPGHVVTITETGLTARRHWEPTRQTIKLASADEYAEALRHHLDEAVRCRLRGANNIGAHLSGGFDSGAVTATAARLLAPSGGKVFAFTAVPREGYDGPAPRNRFVDEGPHAAATAALYPNIEHVLIRSEQRSPLDDLDRAFLLSDQPTLNACNLGWMYSINDAARERKVSIMLTGQMGNMTISYDGVHLLPELIRSGRWLRWWREARAIVGPGRMRWRGALVQSFCPWMPVAIWNWLNRVANDSSYDVLDYTAIRPDRLINLGLPKRARERNLDLSYRPWKDGVAMRLWVLRRGDFGTYHKAIRGGWRIDMRDPTADRRLVEFCLAVPTEQFLHDGQVKALPRRAFSSRLPKLVLDEKRKGLQAADWHEKMTAIRSQIAAEIDRFDDSPSAARALDVARMRKLVENWPAGGWEQPAVTHSHRLALLRGVAVGHFLRRATGANR